MYTPYIHGLACTMLHIQGIKSDFFRAPFPRPAMQRTMVSAGGQNIVPVSSSLFLSERRYIKSDWKK